MDHDFTFEEIQLGSTVTYRGAGGFMKDGRVVAKKQALIRVWAPLASGQHGIIEKLRVSITLKQKTAYGTTRVTLTQFKNVRSVV
jgi:hypothetical protein